MALACGLGKRIFGRSTLIPLHLQRGLGPEGVPGGFGDDGNSRHDFERIAGAIEYKGIDNARHLLDLVQIGALDLAAGGGALRVISDQHAGHLYVDAEQRLAGNYLRIVDPSKALAQQLVLSACLQRHFGDIGHGLCRSVLGQRAIG